MKRLPRLLSIFLAVIFVLSVLGYGATWAEIHLRHKPMFPYGITFLPNNYLAVDLLCFQDRFLFFHQAGFFGTFQHAFNYPPPVAVAYHVVYAFGDYARAGYLVPVSFCLLCAAVLFARAMMLRGLRVGDAIFFVALSAGLSYPFTIASYLANMELLVWIILSLGIFLFLKGYGWQAAVLFGIAASFKYFPAIYLALPLARKRYGEALLVPIVCVATLIGSAWYVGPSVHAVFSGLHSQTQTFQKFYIDQFHPLENSIDHSLFGLGKYALYTQNHLRFLPRLAPFYLVSVALLGSVLWLLLIRKLPIINQVLALSVASVLLPPVSHDYTLMHLYAPWAMLVLACISVQRKGMGLAFACFALLFTPQSYLIYHSVRFAGQFKAVVLLVLFVISLVYPFEDSFADRESLAFPTNVKAAAV